MSSSAVPHSILRSLSDILHARLKEDDTPDFLIARWCEADGECCYLVRKDGALLGIGDYEYGYGSVEEMICDTTQDLRCIRAELSALVGHLEVMDKAEEDEVRELLLEDRLSMLKDQFTVTQAPTLARLFELAHTLKGYLLCKDEALIERLATRPLETFIAKQAIKMSRLTTSTEGHLTWKTETVVSSGETVQGIGGGIVLLKINEGYLEISNAHHVLERASPSCSCHASETRKRATP